tara:strand:+ start:761 stop:1891 length:1131 start_codon:yes stop_codon:yes gene_type:complete
MIPFFKIHYDNRELASVTKVIKSGNLSMGKKTQLFENELEKKLRLKKNNIAAVSNCTVALHLALVSSGVRPGDEVLCSSLTFVADANCIRYVGAKPVFVDINSGNDLNISIENLKKKFTKKTKAIIMTHYAGFPCDIEAIRKIANERNLTLIEDACHTIFSKYKKKYFGTYGDYGVFSLYGNKNITTGEGGLIISNQKNIKKIKKLRNHGIEKSIQERFQQKNPVYEIKNLGYNYRYDDIRSAIAIEQLKKIDFINYRRKQIANNYRKLIKEKLSNIIIPFEKYFSEDFSYHLFVIILPKEIDRNKLIKFLFKEGIETSVHYQPIHKFKLYHRNKFKLKNLDMIYKRILSLPIYPDLKLSEQKKIISKIEDYAKKQ